jgi:hypothetical protein
MTRRSALVTIAVLILSSVTLIPGLGRASGTASCATDWMVVPSPSVGSNPNFLFGVTAVSANDVWAVGQAGNVRALSEHWDGQAWTPVDVPSKRRGHLLAASAVSSHDVWGVGVRVGGQGEDRTLTDHWDGSAWTQVPSVDQQAHGFLASVAAIAPDDVWAVGFGGLGAMAEHWNGTKWTLASVPRPDSTNSTLNGVAAAGPNDVWAVGNGSTDTNHARTLIEHWDGSSWTIVNSPNRVGMANTLEGVVVVSPNDVWAVGWSGTLQFPQQSMTVHWDGVSWSIVSSPPALANLRSVAAVSASNIWAVGFILEGNHSTTVVEHWDGVAWSVVPSPNPSTKQNSLEAVTALPTGELWAVGSKATSRYETLIESACMS